MSLALGARRGHDRGSKCGSSEVCPYPCTDMHLLELTVMSAQNLYPQFKKMRTYAVATVYDYPKEELATQIDTSGGTDPTWNDKFVIRVDGSFLRSDTSTINVTIFAVRKWGLGTDCRLGQTRILVKTFLNPKDPTAPQTVALQIKRPKTLRPQGILNVAINLLSNNGTLVPSNHDYGGRRSVALSGITSRPNSTRFEMARKIDKDIEYAISEQRRQIDYSGPLDKSPEQELTEREALLSKLERYKNDLSPDHDLADRKALLSKIEKCRGDLTPAYDPTNKKIKKQRWQRHSYGSARFWFCGCRSFNDPEEKFWN